LESARLDLAAHAHLLEEEHDGRHERLADVKSGKRLALEERDVQATPAEERRGRRTARAAAHDDDVVARIAHGAGSCTTVDPRSGTVVAGAAESRSWL